MGPPPNRQNDAMTIDELVEAWRVNDALNREWLALCADEDFDLKPGKGKTIRSNFVHIVGVRRMWLEEKVPKAASAVPKLDWKAATREEIAAGLELTHRLMADLFRQREERTRPDRWSTVGFLAYCIAHEAHHRSQIEIAMRINGREPDDQTLYGLWDWTKK